MRRLPIFFLIDVSESMIGEPLKKVNEGLQIIVTNLRSNPMALETAYLSLIVFAGKPKTLCPLTELLQFEFHDLPIGGGTSLGSAMNYLMDEIDSQVQNTTSEMKGDWKPIIFLLTDGTPTDNMQAAVQRWKTSFNKKVTLIAISIGDQADTSILKQFTENVLIFDNTDPKSYAEFFKWVSASIESKSVNVAMGSDDFKLPETNESVLKKEDNTKRKSTNYDDRFAILLARCIKTKHPYLMKFNKKSSDLFEPVGSFVINEEYFDLTEGEQSKLNTKYIANIPQCPDCGNPGLAYCQCGHLFCIGSAGAQKCPWCNQQIEVGYGDSFDISRAQG